jgi:hypothetical protein
MSLVGLYWQSAKTGAWPAIEAEIRRRAFAGAEQRSRSAQRFQRGTFPRLERAQNLLAINTHMLEKEEREQ